MKIYKPTDSELRQQIRNTRFGKYVMLIFAVIFTFVFVLHDEIWYLVAMLLFFIIMTSFLVLSEMTDKIRLEIRELKRNKT